MATTTTPPIPVGLATKAGLASALGAAIAALVAALQGTTPETIGALTYSALSLLTVLGGRYAQAAQFAKATVTDVVARDGDNSTLEASDGESVPPTLTSPTLPETI